MKRTFRNWGGRPWWFWRRVANRKKRWTPNELESSLLAWWDAGHGVSASTWVDRKAGLVLTASGAPAWSATSFNGFPGITFDGVDDYYTLASVPFPTGANPCEIWIVCSQDALPADTTSRRLFGYGGTANPAARLFQRIVTGGVNRIRANVGDGAVGQAIDNTTVDFSSRHLLRLSVGATASSLYVDGGSAIDLSVVPATGTTRVRIGASQADTAASFWSGKVRDIVVTGPLSSDDAASLQSYLLDRRAL
jgi:hypothetical protein